jgi:hypothetical protein
LSDSNIVTLEDRISNIEKTIKELKSELSITLEYFAETRQLLTELSQLSKKTELLEQPRSLLESNTVPSNSKSSKLDTMIEKCVSNIIRDYKESFKK